MRMKINMPAQALANGLSNACRTVETLPSFYEDTETAVLSSGKQRRIFGSVCVTVLPRSPSQSKLILLKLKVYKGLIHV